MKILLFKQSSLATVHLVRISITCNFYSCTISPSLAAFKQRAKNYFPQLCCIFVASNSRFLVSCLKSLQLCTEPGPRPSYFRQIIWFDWTMYTCILAVNQVYDDCFVLCNYFLSFSFLIFRWGIYLQKRYLGQRFSTGGLAMFEPGPRRVPGWETLRWTMLVIKYIVMYYFYYYCDSL